MKKHYFFCFFLISYLFSFGQEDTKRVKLIHISVGPGFSNFLGSEAPHKINIYQSDIYPAMLTDSDVTRSIGYFDYNTSLIKDIKVGFAARLGFEYYLRKDLSLILSFGYEDKGINLKNRKQESHVYVHTTPPESLPIPPPPTDIVYYDEIFEVKIENQYLTLPFLLRKYISKHHFYIQGGFYTGWLLKSQIYTYNRKHNYIPDYDFYGSDFMSGIDNSIDKDKEFTTHFDFGVSAGIGFTHNLTNKLIFNSDLILNLGLRKIDRKYNNEYSEERLPVLPPYILLRSTNYYGLNSNAKNISATFTIGLGYTL